MTNKKCRINVERLLATLGGNSEALNEVLGVFLQDIQTRIRKLGDAARTSMNETIIHEAHTIKGGAAAIGARPLQELAASLELAGASGDDALIGCLVGQITEEVQLLKLEIHQIRPPQS